MPLQFLLRGPGGDVERVPEGDHDPGERERYAELVPFFELMEDLCIVLAGQRYRRGAVDFDLPEARIEFDDREGRIEPGSMVDVLAAWELTKAHGEVSLLTDSA